MKKHIILSTIIVLLFMIAILVNFFAYRNARLKDIIRYPHPEIWSLERAPTFKDFSSRPLFRGNSAEVEVNTSSITHQFRSALRDSITNGPNFAGQYVVANWGCGTGCQYNMIVDFASGKVYDALPKATSRGVDHKVDSILFIVNPPDDDRDEYVTHLPVEYYVWRDHKLIQIYQEECAPVSEYEYMCK